MRVFAVVNQKGGCGKTTTAINLAGVFAARGYRTLLIDMDPQGHCAAGLAIPEQRIDLQIGDAMLADSGSPVDPNRLLWRVLRNLDLAPSTLRLAALEASRGELANLPDAERRLKLVLDRFEPQYDICMIDCSPAVGMLAFNAMVAAGEIIIPVETGFFSLQGATKQINAIKSLGKRLGVAPTHYLLATMHDPSSALSQDLLDELRRRFGARVLASIIRYDHALREAASFGQPVIEYAPDSAGAADYGSLADLLISLPKPHPAAPATTGAEALDAPKVSITTAPQNSQAASYAQAARSTVPLPAAPATTPAPEPSDEQPVMSRQLDMVMRSRRIHAPQPDAASPAASGLAHLSLTEVKPVTDLFNSPPSAPAQSAPQQARPAPSTPARAPTLAPDTSTYAYGLSQLDNGLLFRQPAGIGRSVAVAGDFNAWNPTQGTLELDPASGVLERRIVCPPGTYQYRLVVDGQWMPDPYNPVISSNPFGGSNSVAIRPARVTIPGTPAHAHAPASSRSES